MTIKKITPVSETYATNTGYFDKYIKENANIKDEDCSAGEKIKKILDEKGKPVPRIYDARGKWKKNYNDKNSSVDIKV